ncbi:MAG TPA: hypothetical protein VEF33_02835 [Syntrophales bacterium]|nr:hypothetical protein [Syntrophales bacterium]
MSISTVNVSLTIDAGLIAAFSQLLQNGFWLKGDVDCSVKSFLCEQFVVSPEYLEKRIQTIFLNGQPVDDTDTAIVRDGAILTLSAAMPGLAGAVMRKGGFYASMREQISYKTESTSCSAQPGRVLVKLFNLPLQELGPFFLEHGIWIDGNIFKNVITVRLDDFRTSCKEVLVNGRRLEPDQLLKMDWGNGDIFLKVKTI